MDKHGTKIEWTQKDSDRFDSYINKGPYRFVCDDSCSGDIIVHIGIPMLEGDCWEWIGGRHVFGYGKFWLNGRTIGAHVFAFVRKNGFQPPVVRHSCDNPWCVNPAHLLGGTTHDNVLDTRERGRIEKAKRIEKKRTPYKHTEGSHNGRAIMTDTQVLEIRQRYAEEGRTSLRLLASEYKVSKTLIQRIVQGKVWRHI